MLSTFEIKVTTARPPMNCEIVGTVHHYQSQQWADDFFKKKKLFHNQIVEETIKLLVVQAQEAGANAIYGLTINLIPAPGAMAAGLMFHVYGTAVKND